MLQQYHMSRNRADSAGRVVQEEHGSASANQLSELLWVNRHRLQAGEKIQGVRRICIVSERDLADRRLTAARYQASQQRTRVINKIKQFLRRHNCSGSIPPRPSRPTKVVNGWNKYRCQNSIAWK